VTKKFAWRARGCPRPAWNKNAEVVHQRPPPAANRRKNGPPTPRGRKRPLRWDGTLPYRQPSAKDLQKIYNSPDEGAPQKSGNVQGCHPRRAGACQSVGLVCSARFDKSRRAGMAPPDRRSATFVWCTPDDFVIGCCGTGAEARAVRRQLMGRPTAMPDLPYRARPRLHSRQAKKSLKSADWIVR